MQGEIAYVGLGSNLGARESMLDFAVEALSSTRGVEVTACSAVYETDPVGGSSQGAFLNAVVELRSTLDPGALLDVMLEIERRAGRVREEGERFGPRTLDLDLLLYGAGGSTCIDEPRLIVPHPRLHERGFVLEPLRELAGALRHPRIGDSIEALAARVRDERAVRPWPHRLGT